MSTGKTYSTKYLLDSNNNRGAEGQVLSSTDSGIDWVTLSEISGVDGTGTANYLSKWLDANTITNSLVYDNGTNVGIGTTSPAAKLHIDVATEDNQPAFKVTKVSDNNESAMEVYHGTSSTTRGIADFTNALGSVMYLRGDGNVGIGTTGPTAPLDVLGVRAGRDWSIANRATIRLDSNGTGYPSDILFGHTAAANQSSWTGAYWAISSRGSSAGNKFYFYRGGGNASNASEGVVMAFNPNGDVGIGIDSPTSSLHIRRSTPSITLETAANSNDPIINLKSSGAITGEGAQMWYDNSIGSLHIQTTYPNNAADIVFHTATGADKSTGNIRMVIGGDGNVGIGTTSPSTKLQVAGTSQFDGNLNVANSTLSITAAAPNMLFVVPSGGLDSRIFNDGSGNFIIGHGTNSNTPTERLRINSSGNVGIGTTNPIANLHVNGDVQIGSSNNPNSFGALQVNQASNVDEAGIGVLSSGTGRSIRIWVDETRSYINSGNGGSGDLILNEGAGEVGIGTTNPSAKLHVAGSARIGGALNVNGAISNSNGTVRIESASGQEVEIASTRDIRLLIDSNNDDTTNRFEIQSNTSVSNDNNIVFVVEQDGKVGIGNTAPLQKLSVNGIINSDTNEDYYGAWMSGNSAAGQDSYFAAGTWYNNAGYFKFIQSGTPHRLSIYTYNTADHVTLQEAGGNVGIGTTSPDQKLEVNGNAHLNYSLIGRGIRSSNRGELHLNATSTNDVSEIFFGHGDGYTEGNIRWAISDRGFTDGRLDLYRGPAFGGFSAIQSWDENGNVGIGTTGPATKLHVVGRARFDDTQINAKGVFADYFSSGQSLTLNSGASASILFKIGNTTALTLDSSTNATFAGDLSVDNITSTSNGGSASIYINSTRPTLGFTDSNSFTDPNDIYIVRGHSGNKLQFQWHDNSASTTTETFNIDNAGNATFAGDLTVSGGDITLGGTGRIQGVDTVTDATDAANKAYVDAQVGSADTLQEVTDNGNTTTNSIGIGTTSPSEKLDIRGGDLQIYNSYASGVQIKMAHYDPAAGTTYDSSIIKSVLDAISPQDAGSSMLRFYTNKNSTTNSAVALDLTKDKNAIFYGNVGVGITDPDTELEVGGTIKASTHADAIVIGSPTTVKWKMGVYGANDLLIRDPNNNTKFSILSGGNVGIGTTSPTTKLHIDDNATTGTGLLVTGGGVGGPLATFTRDVGGSGTIAINASDSRPQIKLAASSNTFALGVNGSTFEIADNFKLGTNPRLSITNTGNVGIGITNPSERLHIKNDDASGNNSRCDIRVENGLGYSEFGTLSGYARIQSNGTEAAAINRAASYFYTDYGLFGAHLTATDTGDGVLGINGGGGTGGEAYLKLMRGNVSGFILNHTSSAIQVRATANIPMFFYTNDTIGIKLNANSTVSFPQYGAGTLVTDASGNITVSSGGGAGGPYLPLAGGTLIGNINLNDDIKVRFGDAQDLELYHSSAGDSYIVNKTGVLDIRNTVHGGDIKFQAENPSGTLQEYFRVDGGAGLNRFLKNTKHGDNVEAIFGDSADLKIYHDGYDSYIKDAGTGDLRIVASSTKIYDADSSHFQAVFTDGGSVDLYHGGNKKFETTSTGTITTGNVLATNNIYAGGANGFVFGSSTSEGEYIYRNGNDIRVLAGGADRLTVDGDSGNVGIGTTNPADRLHLGTSSNLLFERGGELRSKDTGGGVRTITRVNSANELEYGWSGAGPVKFMGGGSYAEKMRIHTNGNVGIGTTSPSSRLEVVGGSQNTATFENLTASQTVTFGSTANTSFSDIILTTNSGTGEIFKAGTGYTSWGGASALNIYNSNGAIAFHPNGASGTNSMFIATSGNVGIGTTNPIAPLDVDGNIYSNGALLVDRILSRGGSTDLKLDARSGYGVNVRGSGNASIAYFDYDSGSVGIGTTSPQTKLHVNGSIGAYTSDYAAGSTGSRLLMKTFATTGNTYSFIQAQDVGGVSNNVLALQPYGDNVGIGTTSPAEKLHVGGDIRVGNGGASEYNHVNFTRAGGSNVGAIGWHSDNRFYIGGHPSFGSTAGNDVRVYGFGSNLHLGDNSNGDVLTVQYSSGNVGIGTTSPTVALDVVGAGKFTGQVTIPATPSASTDAASKGYVDSQSYITAPNAPASVTTTIVGETIDVTFAASTTSDIDAYLVYSSIDGSDYALISLIPPDDFSASMSVIDNAFTETGTQAYRVYAMKKGILSSATTGSVSYTVSSAEPTTMSVINLNNAFYVQWNPPSSNGRFVTAYNVYKDENAIQANLLRSNATLVYSGMNTNYMYQINGTNNNNFHQFWVETTIA